MKARGERHELERAADHAAEIQRELCDQGARDRGSHVGALRLDLLRVRGDRHRLRRLAYLEGDVEGAQSSNRNRNAFLNGFFETWCSYRNFVGADRQLGIEKAAVAVGSHRVGRVGVGIGDRDSSIRNDCACWIVNRTHHGSAAGLREHRCRCC